MIDFLKDGFGFLTDLIQTLGSDWQMWLLLLAGIWIIYAVFRLAILLALGLTKRLGL